MKRRKRRRESPWGRRPRIRTRTSKIIRIRTRIIIRTRTIIIRITNKTNFKIKVLSPLVAYSGPAEATDDDEQLAELGIDSRYIFKGRILLTYLYIFCQFIIFI